MNKIWETYPLTYRTNEMSQIAQWIVTGDSGAVVGLKGCGRSHLLGYLCHRPDALKQYLSPHFGSVALIPVDIYNLPTNDLTSLYRTILHAFYRVRERFDAETQQIMTDLYLENRVHQDPFLAQTAVCDLLYFFEKEQTRIILVINRFDRFCQNATPQMMNTLRGLRDGFRETLSYLMGLISDVAYLPNQVALGDMYELLVGRVCWVGAMSQTDACQMIEREFENTPYTPDSQEIVAMLRLSGCFPSLLKATAQWRLLQLGRQLPIANWREALIQEYSIQFRLNRIWAGLTQAEQLALWSLWAALSENGSWSVRDRGTAVLEDAYLYTLHQLADKGLCLHQNGKWTITSQLMATYIADVGSLARGGIRVDDTTRVIYQGQRAIEDLTPLEYEILRFLVKQPRVKHTRDDVIDHAWPEDEQREGITPNALQVHIRNIRKKIEPNPAQPCYLLTWHGRPGGYQFFPEGKPA